MERKCNITSDVSKSKTNVHNNGSEKHEASLFSKSKVKKEPPEDYDSLIEDKLAKDLRYTLIMKGYEKKLQNTAEHVFKNLVESMIAKRADTMQKYWKKQSEECERRVVDLKARKLKMLKELKENDNLAVLEKAKIDEQNSQIINRQTIENMNKILEEQNKATKRFAAITDSHTIICVCYNEISLLLQSEPIAKSVCEKYIPEIKNIVVNINLIMDKCKTCSFADKEVKQAEVFSANIVNIRRKIVEDMNGAIFQMQQAEEAAKRKELEAKREQEEKAAQVARAQKAAAEEAKKNPPMFHSAKNYVYYQQLKKFLEEYENQYKELLENVNLKKFRFDCQKAVNTPVNSLSSVSGSIQDKYHKLSKLLKGKRVQVLDIYVTATQHPQGLAYCTALLAKKIVRQGDLLVSSNPEAAFPLASVSVALWAHFPDFGRLLEANFHKVCPYLVPMFLPQKEGQTDKEFYLSRGYTYNEEGTVEKQDKFLKRMSGIFRLMCAIWTAAMPRFIHEPNPHGLCYGWQWLASFINLKAEPDICATLLHDFFTVCGSEFYKYYGKQFTKVIKLISTQYLAVLQNIDEGGPKTRLEVYLQNILSTGHIPPHSGMLQSNAW